MVNFMLRVFNHNKKGKCKAAHKFTLILVIENYLMHLELQGFSIFHPKAIALLFHIKNPTILLIKENDDDIKACLSPHLGYLKKTNSLRKPLEIALEQTLF